MPKGAFLDEVILGAIGPGDPSPACLEQVRAVAVAINEHFDVREKVASLAGLSTSKPAEGQTWRNKQSDRLVRVVKMDVGFNRAILWEALTGRGPRNGRVWANYWTSRFEFVEEAPDGGDRG